MKHGYAAYSNGCRCRTCRAAKADYMAAKRAAAIIKATTGPDSTVDGIKHGTRVGYKDHGCRCAQCITAMRAYWYSESQRRRAKAAS